MVGFLDRLFGMKKKREDKGKQLSGEKLNLKGLEKRLKSSMAVERERASKLLMEKAEKILDLKKGVVDSVDELGEHEFPEDVKKRVYKPAITHRPTYIRGVHEAISGMSLPQESFEGLKEFYKATLAALKAVEKVQLHQGRYLVVVFREELLSLGKVLNRIIDINQEMGELLSESEEKLGLIEDLDSKRQELEEKLVLLRGIADRKRDLKKESNDLERAEKAKGREISAWESGETYQGYLKKREQLGGQEQKREMLRSRVLNIIGPKNRIFRKYKKLLGSPGEKDKILNGYIKDPSSTFFSEEAGYSGLKGIMEGLRRTVEEGSLVLSTKEKEKLHLEEALMDDLMKEFQGLTDMPIDPEIEEKHERLLGDLEKIRDDVKRIRDEKETLKKESKDLKKQIPDLRSKLEEELSGLEEEELRVKIEIRSIPRSSD
ncbi:MAG: hypothetical protein V3T58_06295 [Candidatus Hydrothermarchaeales archaeon]